MRQGQAQKRYARWQALVAASSAAWFHSMLVQTASRQGPTTENVTNLKQEDEQGEFQGMTEP